VIGFKSLAIENPNGNLNQVTTDSPDAPLPIYNPLLRFGIASLVYVIIAVVQVLIPILNRFSLNVTAFQCTTFTSITLYF